MKFSTEKEPGSRSVLFLLATYTFPLAFPNRNDICQLLVRNLAQHCRRLFKSYQITSRGGCIAVRNDLYGCISYSQFLKYSEVSKQDPITDTIY